MAHLPVKLWNETYRELDVANLRAENLARCRGKYWDGADLLMEVVSETHREHDTETKREEYARTGIPEYWIVDPSVGKVTVLRLDGQQYKLHGEFVAGQVATSLLLPGFSADVSAVLAAE